MRRQIIGGALAAVLASSAYAQSSVTLYGIVDTGISYISNSSGHSVVRMDSGINQNSRWGLLGTEDLGGGLQAIFRLESEFFLDTGESAFPNTLFTRAYAGLSSQQWGTLVMGRNYDFVPEYVTYYTSVSQFAPGYSFHLANDIDRLAGEPVTNSVRYETPTVHGLTAGAMYGFDNGSTASSPHVLSFGLHYSPSGKFNAPYSFSAAYTKTVGGSLVPSASGALPTATLAQIASGARSIYTAALGGQVKFGDFALNGVYTYTNQSGITHPGPQVAKVTAAYELGLTYRVTPSTTFGVGDTYIDQHNTGKYDLVSLGLDYRLSKQTDVFLFGTYQKAFGGATIAGNFLAVTPGLPWEIAGMSTSREQLAAQLGIRHLF
ncbi:Outer membrane protein (porin) [Burkholderia sp. D7]|nr:Outer membrane protein (porin) [Burkholderia sp. D7]